VVGTLAANYVSIDRSEVCPYLGYADESDDALLRASQRIQELLSLHVEQLSKHSIGNIYSEVPGLLLGLNTCDWEK